VNTASDRIVRHTGLSTRAKMVRAGCSLQGKFT